MHGQIADIINHTKKSGIDAALTTNAVLLKEAMSEKILGAMEWMKVSIGAAKRRPMQRFIGQSRKTLML